MSEEIYTFTCEGSRDGRHCGAYYVGKPHELKALGWVRHEYSRAGMRRKGEFLLCDECERHYARIWKKKDAEKKAAA